MATALYRRYRPETFAELVGQDHVTEPLRAALRAGRPNHAYLFSGPRGCGKTTSARILARCLNCVRGPTHTPCGECDSCRELARGGSGSLDVVEIDAASHGGVDDARDLRERAAFAPARDRYKIYIIDEAHMVSPQGFNALLKIVEEPPEHVMFVFATTEPDKVLGTIRSRTHHYPFHLVPPQVLTTYLQQVCDAEGVAVGKGVLPLVVRAGAGSVRDSLSVLDQLAAGSGSQGLDYEQAVGLLGYTHAALLDDVVTSLAAADGASVFRVVDRVISSGQDPRRFVDDLLERLRDLVIVQAVGERAADVFPDVPDDQLERMAVQAAAFGTAQLSRAADLTNVATTEMTGATSPRLHLELLCARLLLPAADASDRGLAARLDRVERRLAVPVPAAPPPTPPAATSRSDARADGHGTTEGDRTAAGQRPTSAGADEPPAVTPDQSTAAPPAGSESLDATEAVRRMWPEILDHLGAAKRRTWTRVSADAHVRSVDERQIVLQFRKAGTMAAFLAGPHADAVRESVIAVLGLDREVVAVADEAPAPRSSPAAATPDAPPARHPGSVTVTAAAPTATPPGPSARPTGPAAPSSSPSRRSQPWAAEPSDLPSEPPGDDEFPPESVNDWSAQPAREPGREPPPDTAGPRQPSPAPPLTGAAIARSVLGSVPAPTSSATPAAQLVDDGASRDDDDAESSALVGVAVAEQFLGGRVIGIEERR